MDTELTKTKARQSTSTFLGLESCSGAMCIAVVLKSMCLPCCLPKDLSNPIRLLKILKPQKNQDFYGDGRELKEEERRVRNINNVGIYSCD